MIEQISRRGGYLRARETDAQRAPYCYSQDELERAATQASDAEKDSDQAFQAALQGNVITKIRAIVAVFRGTYQGAQKAYRAARTEGKVPELNKPG